MTPETDQLILEEDISPEGVTANQHHTAEELEKKSVVQLKTLARERGHRGVAIDYYKKEQLVKLLLGNQPTSVSPPSARNNQAPSTSPDLADVLANALKDRLHVQTELDPKQIEATISEKFDKSLTPLRFTVEEHQLWLEEIKGSIKHFDKRIKEAVEAIQKNVPISVEVKKLDGSTACLGLQHRQFPDLLKLASVNLSDSIPKINIWLVGEAGTGKTTAAEKIAEALGLEFYFNGAIDSEYKLRGFIDANGKIVFTPFRRAYENGGVYLFDEVDSSLPPALLAFNAALANNHYDFPEGTVKRHPQFVCIAAANTFGLGGTTEYVGRLKQDAAFVDRFVQFEWHIDESLERALSGNTKWVQYVQEARQNAKAQGVRVVISPRASMFGATLLAAGFTFEQTINMTLKKGMASEQWDAIKPTTTVW